MERPKLESVSSGPRPRLPEVTIGIPEMLAMGFLVPGERFVIVAGDGTEHAARLLAHGGVELGGETYVNLRQAMTAFAPTGVSPTISDCLFERDGRVTLWHIRCQALKHPDVGCSPPL